MKNKPESRTLGKVIYAWKNHGVYSPEIASVISDIEKVHGLRNDIHLYARFGRSWEQVVDEETVILDSIEGLFEFFQKLDPV